MYHFPLACILTSRHVKHTPCWPPFQCSHHLVPTMPQQGTSVITRLEGGNRGRGQALMRGGLNSGPWNLTTAKMPSFSGFLWHRFSFPGASVEELLQRNIKLKEVLLCPIHYYMASVALEIAEQFFFFLSHFLFSKKRPSVVLPSFQRACRWFLSCRGAFQPWWTQVCGSRSHG